MFTKRIATACLIGALSIAPVTRAAADSDALVGGIVGGIVGGVIVNEANRNRQQRTRTVVRQAPRVSSATRSMNRETQTSLNYFGFPAGTPDGVLGRNSRYAISQYQAHMGYPSTGYLSEYERQFLIGSYHRAISGGAMTAQLIHQRGEGPRGLLRAYRDEASGIASYPVGTTPGKTDPEGAYEGTNLVATKPEEETNELPTPEVETGQGQMALLPNFMGAESSGPSLASHCNQVSLLTSSNGGFVTEASMTDPGFALNEQFCLARTYAIAEGESLSSSLQGVTSAQLEEQCQAFGPAMRDHVAALSLKPHTEVMQDVSGFILSTGMSPAQLTGTAKICLSVGYRTDNMDVALGSALLLTVLGEQVYAELLGHHLSQGFGTSKRSDLALAWYQLGFDALASGSEAVFAPGNPDRGNLIRRAAFQLNGQQDAQATVPSSAVQPASSLPTFNVDQ